jgi:hypothetical protein
MFGNFNCSATVDLGLNPVGVTGVVRNSRSLFWKETFPVAELPDSADDSDSFLLLEFAIKVRLATNQNAPDVKSSLVLLFNNQGTLSLVNFWKVIKITHLLRLMESDKQLSVCVSDLTEDERGLDICSRGYCQDLCRAFLYTNRDEDVGSTSRITRFALFN